MLKAAARLLDRYLEKNKVSPKQLPGIIEDIQNAVGGSLRRKTVAKAKSSKLAARTSVKAKSKPTKTALKKKAAAEKKAARARAAAVVAQKRKLAKPTRASGGAPILLKVMVPSAAIKASSRRRKLARLGIRAPGDPIVSVRHSLASPDFIICLEDGKKFKMMKRHLRATYGMSPDDYRAKWSLPASYPMVARGYAAEKSDYAKFQGLGTLENKAGQKSPVASVRKVDHHVPA